MLELDVGGFMRLGQRFRASIFADVGAFWMVSDRTIKFRAEQEVLGVDCCHPGIPRSRFRVAGATRFDRFRADSGSREDATGRAHEDLQYVTYRHTMDEVNVRLGFGFRLAWHPF